jgi:hypothetical protein
VRNSHDRCVDTYYNGDGLRHAPQANADDVIRTIVSIVATLALAACGSAPSRPASSVQDGDPATVNRDCKLLGTVNGRSIFGGGEATRQDDAMLDARAKAAAMGATHVVFLNIDTSGMFNTGHASARAYRCGAKE